MKAIQFNPKYNIRESAAELLRIICMFMIVMHHFLVHGLFPETFDPAVPLTAAKITSIVLNGFLSVGVNCFVLISGYYSIRFKWKGLLNLYFTCFFYGLLGYCVYIIVGHHPIGGGLLWNSVFIFSHSGWWFINCYLILFLMSPLLNAGMEHLDKKQYKLVLCLLTIANVYFGYIWKTDSFNTTGYTAAQFVYIYLIGGYIRRYMKWNEKARIRRYSVGIYILSVLVWGGLAILNYHYPFGYVDYVYNNPFILIASIAFFIGFMTFKFKTPFVNWLAMGCIAAYLLQDHPLLRQLLYPQIYFALENKSLEMQISSVVVVSIFFLCVALLFDKIRQSIQPKIVSLITG